MLPVDGNARGFCVCVHFSIFATVGDSRLAADSASFQKKCWPVPAVFQ